MSLHFRVQNRIFLQCFLLMLCLLISASTSAADVQAFVGARIVPVSSEVIEEGTLLVRDGKIEQVGPVKDVIIPDGAVRIDVTGKTIIPGLICTHSHIGWGGGGDSSEPIQPECHTLDSVDVRSASFMRARAGGLTLVNQMPGSGHLISGRTTYLKLRDGGTVEDLLVHERDQVFSTQ